jgi:toluene monooxygenase system protein E
LGLLSALRFALHGQQMVAAYVGSMAPSGRVSVAAAFQAADEMRRIQRICQWLSRSGVSVAQLDALGRELWQQSPSLQPWRRLIETLLVTYDFGLALLALNGVIKPVFDRLWLEQLAAVAERHHDEVLEKILGSLADDGRWHEMWFIELAKLLAEDEPENLRVMREQVATLRPQVSQAVHALLPQFGGVFGDEGERAYVWRELDQALDAHLRQLGLSTAERAGGTA